MNKILLLVVLVSILSCQSNIRVATPTNTSPLQHVGKSAVALMLNDHAFCSGNFVSKDLILTAQHCTELAKDNKMVSIQFIVESDGLDIGQQPEHPYTATVLKEDVEHDLALLKVEQPPVHDILTLSNTIPDKGDVVFNVSNPKGALFTYLTGRVSAYRKKIPNDTRQLEYLQIDCSATFGSSGSAFTNSNGEIIGVAEAVIQPNNQVLAVHLKHIRGFLANEF